MLTKCVHTWILEHFVSSLISNRYSFSLVSLLRSRQILIDQSLKTIKDDNQLRHLLNGLEFTNSK